MEKESGKEIRGEEGRKGKEGKKNYIFLYFF